MAATQNLSDTPCLSYWNVYQWSVVEQPGLKRAYQQNCWRPAWVVDF